MKSVFAHLNDLGAAMKRLRLERNETRRSLAARAGVGVNSMRNLEDGKGVTLKTFIAVSCALDAGAWIDEALQLSAAAAPSRSKAGKAFHKTTKEGKEK